MPTNWNDSQAKASIDLALLGKAPTGHTHAFADLTGRPTSLDGYGVTDIAEPWNTPPSGELVMTTIGGSDTIAGSARVANALEMFQFVPKATITISQVVLNVVTGAGLGRVLIYDTDANGLPTTLLYNSGDIDTSSAGAKSADCAMTLLRGKRYWIATWFSAASTMSVWATTSLPDINGGEAPVTTARKVARRTVTFASAPPDPWGWSSAEITAARPAAVWLMVA